MNQFLEIPFRLPSLNEVNAANRQNRFAGARLKRQMDEALSLVIKAAHLKPVQKPCIVHMMFEEPNKRRDVDNVESAKKFILDALVKSGVLQNDTPKYVLGSPGFTRYSEGGTRVLVTIIEDEDEERLREKLRNASDVITEDNNARSV